VSGHEFTRAITTLLPFVILSDAEGAERDWGRVEGSRECFPCHADQGNSLRERLHRKDAKRYRLQPLVFFFLKYAELIAGNPGSYQGPGFSRAV